MQAEGRGRSSEVLPDSYSCSWLNEEREVLVWSNGDVGPFIVKLKCAC